MKQLFTFTILFSALTSTPTFADSKNNSNAVIAGTSAGAMVAGTSAVRGMIAAQNIEAKYSKPVYKILLGFTTDYTPDASRLNNIKPGDKVVISYTSTKSVQIKNIELQKLKDDRRLILRRHHGNVEAPQFIEMDQKIRSFADTIPTKQKVLADANVNDVLQKIDELKASGKTVTVIKRVDGRIMTKVRMASRNGWILAATAVSLGLITAEEIHSGRIGRSLDNEYKNLKNN